MPAPLFSAFSSSFRDLLNIDVLVSIDPKAQIGLLDIAQMQIELEQLFKRPVDLVEKEGFRDPYRTREILRTARVGHVTVCVHAYPFRTIPSRQA